MSVGIYSRVRNTYSNVIEVYGANIKSFVT